MRSAATGSELHKFDVGSKQQSFEKAHHLQRLTTATPDVHGGSAQLARHGENMDHLVENKT
jgi:hypothetical protein